MNLPPAVGAFVRYESRERGVCVGRVMRPYGNPGYVLVKTVGITPREEWWPLVETHLADPPRPGLAVPAPAPIAPPPQSVRVVLDMEIKLVEEARRRYGNDGLSTAIEGLLRAAFEPPSEG